MTRTIGLVLVLLFVLFLLWLTFQVHAQDGGASWYSMGHRTADGHGYNPGGISCAHRTAHFGTRLRVTDLATGRSITCTVTDRGPFVRGRIIDLSLGAARALGIIGRGVARVRVEGAR